MVPLARPRCRLGGCRSRTSARGRARRRRGRRVIRRQDGRVSRAARHPAEADRRPRMLPAMAALSDGDLAAYHGVEHKAIAAYERQAWTRPTPPRSTSAAARTWSGRCLSFRRPASSHVKGRPTAGPAAARAAGLASLSLAVELFAYAERSPDSPFGRGDPRLGTPRSSACSRPASPAPSSSRSASPRSRTAGRGGAGRARSTVRRVQPSGGTADTF